MFGEAAYALPLARDPAYQRQQHAASTATFAVAANEVVLPNRPVLLFLGRSAGMLILMKLVQRLHGGREGRTLSYTDIGTRFGVSRTHVRDLLAAAARDGGVTLEGRGQLRLMPQLLAAFDRNVADGMSMHDLAHRVAMAKLHGAIAGDAVLAG